MKLNNLLAICLLAAGALTASARDAWLHIYRNDTIVVTDKETDAVRFYGNFNSFPMADVDSLRFVADRESDKMKRLRIHYRKEGNPASKIISLNCIRKWDIGPNPPEFHITTVDNPELTDVESKTQYLNARLKVNGFGLAADFEGDALVRGRGNSTWNHPKKAYRLKLPVKTGDFLLSRDVRLGDFHFCCIVHHADNIILLKRHFSIPDHCHKRLLIFPLY